MKLHQIIVAGKERYVENWKNGIIGEGVNIPYYELQNWMNENGVEKVTLVDGYLETTVEVAK